MASVNLNNVKWYSVSYEVLKSKRIYVWSYFSGKRYTLGKTAPMPSFAWKKLDYLPKRTDTVQTQFGSKTYYKLFEY